MSESRPQFLWGVSTSAFQIEGHIENDMTDWERLGNFRNGGQNPLYNVATDHWNRWEQDFELLKELRVNSYRFSVEWARIEPERSRFDQTALDRYSRMIDRLLKLRITPMLTLHHFTHPKWFHRETPWHNPESVEAFSRFTEQVVSRLGDRVDFFVTINEPIVWLLAGYIDAKFPPGKRDVNLMADAYYNMLVAHAAAYDIIKAKNSNTQVGIANNFIVFKTSRKWHPLDRRLKRLVHNFYNLSILEAFRDNRLKIRFPFIIDFDKPISLDDKIDFWGVNYYYRLHVRFRMRFPYPFDFRFVDRSGAGFTDMGWEVYARGLRKVLKWLRESGKPLYITENGIAARDDNRRIEFLKSHLKGLHKAMTANPQIRGYYHWSLLDNYEWLVGYNAQFGLYEVDFGNGLTRTLRPSGRYYADHIGSLNGDGTST